MAVKGEYLGSHALLQPMDIGAPDPSIDPNKLEYKYRSSTNGDYIPNTYAVTFGYNGQDYQFVPYDVVNKGFKLNDTQTGVLPWFLNKDNQDKFLSAAKPVDLAGVSWYGDWLKNNVGTSTKGYLIPAGSVPFDNTPVEVLNNKDIGNIVGLADDGHGNYFYGTEARGNLQYGKIGTNSFQPIPKDTSGGDSSFMGMLGPIGMVASAYFGGGGLGDILGSAGGAADLAGAAPDFTSAAAGYGGATAGVDATTGFDAASLSGASAPADYTGPGIGEGEVGSNVSNPVYDNTPPPETTPTDATTTPSTSGSSTANSLLKNIGTKLATSALLGNGTTSGTKSGATGSAAGTSAPTGPTFDQVPMIPTGRIIDAPKSDVLNPLLFSLAGFPVTNQGTPTQDPYSDTSLGTTTTNTPAPAPVPQPQPEQPQNFAQGGLASVHPAGEPEFYSEGGLHNRYIKGDGDGTSDSIPAMVADSEFVMPADVVAALGNGSSDAGAHKLDMMVQQIRKRARSSAPSELPPTAHESPLDYLKGRA